MRWTPRRTVILVLVAGGLLAAAETAARLLTDYDSKWNIRLGGHRQFDEIAQFRTKPNYRFPDGAVTNESGFLAPRDLTHAKPAGRLRLIYLGDSVSFHPTSANYPAQVERILERETGLEVETVNTAVPGYASHNARALLESDVSRYGADALIVYLGWNDLGQYGPEGLPYKRLAKGYRVGPVERILATSYSWRLVYQLQRMWSRSRPTVNDPLTAEEQRLYESYYPQHFEENLRAILRLATSRYPRVYVLTLATITSDDPAPEELARAHFPVGMTKNMRKLHRLVRSYNEVVRSVAKQEGVSLIDLYAVFDSRGARRELGDSCHVGDAGARRIARAIADRILADGLAAAGVRSAT
jgi:lysophospholipase L1-like esterase